MKEWLDVMQLAVQTNLPDSTVRRYLMKFNQFFTYKGGKRSRRYESSAIRVLLRIKELYAEGFESAEVNKTLLTEFPVVVDSEQTEADLNSISLPALASAEDMADLKEALAKHNELNRLLLQNQHDQNELIKTLIQDNEEQKKFNELLVKALSNEDQQKINQKLLQEFEESKQRDQLLLEKLDEKEEKDGQKEEAAKPPENKKGFFGRLFK